MIYIKIPPETLAEIKREHANNLHPRVRQRMFALLLIGMDFMSHDMISKIVGIDPKTLCSYIKIYNKDGVAGLKKLNHRKQESELVAYTDIIKTELDQHPVFTISQASQSIESVTGLKRKPTQVGVFLKKNGIKRLMIGGVPAKAIDDIKKKSKTISRTKS